MVEIDLKYGHSLVPLAFDPARFRVLGTEIEKEALSDAEIGERLDHPIDSARLEDLVDAGETVLIVVPDATRQTACASVINLVVRRLIANGIRPADISIIFATGIHRKATADEKEAILTPFIAQRIKTLDHDPRDLMQIVRLGETAGGIPIELNRRLTEHDHVILVGGVTFHYFAGFTGGRKLICPGLASSKTVSETHKLAFDCGTRSRRDGVGTGLLEGNAVHEAFIEAVRKIDPAFAITTVVNDAGEATDLFCGNWITSHRAACDAFAAGHTVLISEHRDLVIVSCGGYPYDINMIQAHKALDAAARACRDGGTVLFLAECVDGMGRDDFLDWFDAADSKALAETLCERYQVNGQTAWNLLRNAERINIRMISILEADQLAKMRIAKADISEISRMIDAAPSGYIMPFGAKFSVGLGTIV